jgi:ribosomal protein S18 acetylase RimI-like enzyme
VTAPSQATLRTMTMDDYDAVIELMKATPGVSFRDADSREATARYLARNPGLSFVAEKDGRLVGCLMSGHDGRRGYLQHLVMLPEHRRQGIAKALVGRCLAALEQLGILKSHIDVYRTNDIGQAYWASQGWMLRTDIHRYSHVRSGHENA